MKPEGRRRTTAEDLADIVADDASNCVTCSDYAMDCIEGIQLTIFVELANKLVINEVRHGHSARRIMGRYHCLHLCQRRQRRIRLASQLA